MSILTSIINAILQAIGWILPISEAGHSAVFHDFSGRADGSVWVVTGVVHIGIAIGIVLASFSIFKRMSKEFFSAGKELFKKQLDIKSGSAARRYLYTLMVSFLPMLLWLIPLGKFGFLYSFLRGFSYNGTLLDEGLLLVITGLLLVLASRQLTLGRNDRDVSLVYALIIGFASVLLVPVAGLSLTGGVISVLIILGATKNYSLNFALLMSVPVLFVTGIVEIATADFSAGIVEIIIGAVLSIVAAFICTRVLKYILKNNLLKFFGYYDGAIGIIIAVTGIVQLIVR
jgi:undecaprenyl pyrophosphate phosphatase UppP